MTGNLGESGDDMLERLWDMSGMKLEICIFIQKAPTTSSTFSFASSSAHFLPPRKIYRQWNLHHLQAKLFPLWDKRWGKLMLLFIFIHWKKSLFFIAWLHLNSFSVRASHTSFLSTQLEVKFNAMATKIGISLAESEQIVYCYQVSVFILGPRAVWTQIPPCYRGLFGGTRMGIWAPLYPEQRGFRGDTRGPPMPSFILLFVPALSGAHSLVLRFIHDNTHTHKHTYYHSQVTLVFPYTQ